MNGLQHVCSQLFSFLTSEFLHWLAATMVWLFTPTHFVSRLEQVSLTVCCLATCGLHVGCIMLTMS